MKKPVYYMSNFCLCLFILFNSNGQKTIAIKEESFEKIIGIIAKVRTERINNAIKFKELEKELKEYKESNENIGSELEMAKIKSAQADKRAKMLRIAIEEYKNSLVESDIQMTILKEQYKGLRDDFEKEKNINEQLKLEIISNEHAFAVRKEMDSLTISGLQKLNASYVKKLDDFYLKFDENQIEVEGVQKDLRKLVIIKINTVQDGQVLTMNNEKEINYKALEYFQVSTGKDFNLSDKALKYDLFYIEDGVSSTLVEDEMLWQGKKEKRIVFKKSTDFADLIKGHFIFKVYYESDEKKIEYIKREFSIKEFNKVK